MGNQIDAFKNKYRVIIADSRGHGKSELKTDALSYEQITADWEGLVNYLKLNSISIIGWSDGRVIVLKMGINNKSKIKKWVRWVQILDLTQLRCPILLLMKAGSIKC
jgi:pimeloyl-ACP methyl ester carboxylesterase